MRASTGRVCSVSMACSLDAEPALDSVLELRAVESHDRVHPQIAHVAVLRPVVEELVVQAMKYVASPMEPQVGQICPAYCCGVGSQKSFRRGIRRSSRPV